MVTVGGGWNEVDEYMERHDPVKTFVYEREQLPENKKKYYEFRSIYKYPGYKRINSIYNKIKNK